MTQTTITNGTKTALITSDECENIKSITVIIYVGFGTSSETALRSKSFKSQTSAEKWATAQ